MPGGIALNNHEKPTVLTGGGLHRKLNRSRRVNIQRRMNTVWHNTPNTYIVRQRLEHRPSQGTDALVITSLTSTTRPSRVPLHPT